MAEEKKEEYKFKKDIKTGSAEYNSMVKDLRRMVINISGANPSADIDSDVWIAAGDTRGCQPLPAQGGVTLDAPPGNYEVRYAGETVKLKPGKAGKAVGGGKTK
jgi:hypothetical protein